LVVKSRDDLLPHNLPYAHEHSAADFISAIKQIKPHVLIGETGFPGTFTQEAIKLMTEINERPALFALSNPTSRAECTAEQAYEWSQGRVIFTSGSPFEEVKYEDKAFKPGQGNNAYIFPGIGLGAVTSEATRITEDMFLAAARTLADLVSEEDLSVGSIYPPLQNIRAVSLQIAISVADEAYASSASFLQRPDNLEQYIEDYMYKPNY
jgi:malate dehydrogenase (oxaloacetate-decarboxylating)(NADP+)